MTHAQHTPGFWHEAHGTAICDTRQPLISAEAQEANARPIAAAPELLEAGRNLCAAYDDGDDDAMDSAIAAMRAAISKAKGE